MKTYLATVLILNCLLAFTYAVSDENICDTSCQYCCRNKQCQSESTCKGNYQPFIILGAIGGGLIALFIARRVYVYYRRKNAIAMGRVEEKSKRPSRWRRRKGSKSPAKEKKSKESSSSSKKRKEKSVKSSSVKSLKDADEKKMNMSKGDIYLQIDNESVLSAEDVKSTKNKEKDGDKSLRVTSRNELKPNSKNEILNKSEKDLDNKDRLNPYKQNKIDFPAEIQDKENKKGDKRSTSKGKGTSSSKKTDMKGSTKDMKGSTQMKSSVNQGTAKERGRSKEPSSGKERSASQKKPTSSGPRDGKSRGNSSGPRKNQV